MQNLKWAVDNIKQGDFIKKVEMYLKLGIEQYLIDGDDLQILKAYDLLSLIEGFDWKNFFSKKMLQCACSECSQY